jgi:redox-sensitive bicupin YhaK (pirin superfamily)
VIETGDFSNGKSSFFVETELYCGAFLNKLNLLLLCVVLLCTWKQKGDEMNRKVRYLIPAYDMDMGGITLKQALPTNNIAQVDPFLLLHHAKFTYTSDAPALHQGIGPHPHRGFSPVTFVVDGEVQHRDSWGNNQVAKKGEVQWINAGRGIIHSERPSQKLAEKNGKQEIIQLWINTPAAKKMQEPFYQYLSEKSIPVFSSDDNLIKNKLVAGKYNELRGKIKTDSELLIIWSSAKNGGTQTYVVPELLNTMLYVIRGNVQVSGYGKVEEKSLVVFDNSADKIEISAVSDAQFLLMAGVPIAEEVVQQGPFVMNTTTQILEAMRDYKMGKMGILIEEK